LRIAAFSSRRLDGFKLCAAHCGWGKPALQAMSVFLDPEAAQAAFCVPACDGGFDGDFAHYLGELGERRPSVLLAFAPAFSVK